MLFLLTSLEIRTSEKSHTVGNLHAFIKFCSKGLKVSAGALAGKIVLKNCQSMRLLLLVKVKHMCALFIREIGTVAVIL